MPNLPVTGEVLPMDLTKTDLAPTPSYNLLQGTATKLPLDGQCLLPHCVGSLPDMCPPTYPLECEQCVKECNVENCDLSTKEEEKCTDYCVVVPCDDPCSDSCNTCTTPLDDFYRDGQCQCQNIEDIVSLLPDAPGCQLFTNTQFQDLPYESTSSTLPILTPMSRDRDSPPFPDWCNIGFSKELDRSVCACRMQTAPHSFDGSTCDPRLLQFEKHISPRQQQLSFVPPAPAPSPKSSNSDLHSPVLSACASGSSRSSPHPSPVGTTGSSGASPHTTPSMSRRSDHLTCLWASCGKPFNSSSDLITHVNTVHLRLSLPQQSPSMQAVPQFQGRSSDDIEHATIKDTNLFSCLWNNCNHYPTVSQVPGPSTGNIVDAAKGLLSHHVQQDHLGITVSQTLGRNNTISIGHGESFPEASTRLSMNAPSPSIPSLEHSSATTGPQQDPCADSPHGVFVPPPHRCKWRPCTLSEAPFDSAADLTAHITDAHVGVGNSRYHCGWEGCSRNGDSGFSSKQKILRHIQSHTGYRPYRCDVCDQYFSEVATLQQHMRRHTKEKPYVCDFPGCNKAFAITGALTIHRRVHSGSKPFKCTYCDRSFSESSNLSKHVRTHTGDRPYICPFPGCEKRFARPDQIARHKNVHNKKAKAARKPTPPREEVAMDIEG